jgi:anti-anti-sigma regulatory factor
MDAPARGLPCEITRYGWLAEIAVRDRGTAVDLSAVEEAWARAFARHPTKVVIIDMSAVTTVDDTLARWLIESQRRAEGLDAELFVLAPRGDAREQLRRMAVGSIMTLLDPP